MAGHPDGRGLIPAAPEARTQRQPDACNARDPIAFVACCAEDVTIRHLPATTPALQGRAALADFHARERFDREGLHAELVDRLALGDKVADHERVRGLRPEPHETVAVHQVADGLIRAVRFHPAG
ncbi:nuclear transport factor 2 family protein [Rehaibacterium terrae]|uniref:SnoaL-like domain-containing protein n=1 Tax=Rehaibacterium terrae TaxID=1341696 RepID=A0A7W7Y141_9GAMM|nr:hypothetical protein [Rehaibacterium terrae]